MWTFQTPTPGFFTKDELAQLDALFGEIVLADRARGIPGAREAGAANFVDCLLGMSPEVYWEIPIWGQLYKAGLPIVSEASQKLYGKSLTELSSNQRQELLANLQQKKLSAVPNSFDQGTFFTTLHRHCVQACFSDPRWGGNKDNLMWRWFGYLAPAEEVTWK
jgi:gluconate 2-dehydrogenase gamma chain